MKTVTIHQAKTNLSRLLAEIEEGGEVLIARGRQPIARLVALKPRRPRVYGALQGTAAIGPEFFDPVPDDELDAWDGK